MVSYTQTIHVQCRAPQRCDSRDLSPSVMRPLNGLNLSASVKNMTTGNTERYLFTSHPKENELP